jgi:hypothetical protein
MSVARRALLGTLALPVAAPSVAAIAADEPAIALAGAIAPPAPRRLTRTEIEALGVREMVTTTAWTRGPRHFGGVPLALVLAAVGAQGARLRAVALNDYAVSIPRAEAMAAGAFLATRDGGEPIPVRERGPFWIVFPWTDRPELETARIRQWAIWQLARIEVA